MCGFY